IAGVLVLLAFQIVLLLIALLVLAVLRLLVQRSALLGVAGIELLARPAETRHEFLFILVVIVLAVLLVGLVLAVLAGLLVGLVLALVLLLGKRFVAVLLARRHLFFLVVRAERSVGELGPVAVLLFEQLLRLGQEVLQLLLQVFLLALGALDVVA